LKCAEKRDSQAAEAREKSIQAMCDEFERLFVAYKHAVKLYSTTASAVAAAATVPFEEFARAVDSADDAKTAAMMAGMKLEHHCEEHGCTR